MSVRGGTTQMWGRLTQDFVGADRPVFFMHVRSIFLHSRGQVSLKFVKYEWPILD